MYKFIFFFAFFSFGLVISQTFEKSIRVRGTVKDQTNLLPLINVHILNLNSVKDICPQDIPSNKDKTFILHIHIY